MADSVPHNKTGTAHDHDLLSDHLKDLLFISVSAKSSPRAWFDRPNTRVRVRDFRQSIATSAGAADAWRDFRGDALFGKRVENTLR